jgi:hypothetical protein
VFEVLMGAVKVRGVSVPKKGEVGFSVVQVFRFSLDWMRY